MISARHIAARHPDAFAAHTLSLSRFGRSRSAGERAAWRRGFVAGLSTAVFGGLGVTLLLALLRSV